MSITSTKKTIIIHNFNFHGNFLIQFKKSNKREGTKLHHFFKNWIKLKLKEKKN